MKAKRKLLLSSVVVALVLALAAIGVNYWYQSTYYVSTSNAKVAGKFIKVTPLTSGKLLEFNVKEGDSITKDQILGYLEAGSAAANIRAPISGTVVKVAAHIGEYVFSAQSPTLAMIVDPDSMYINANIEEAEINKLHPGQLVDITVDQYGNKKFTGTVASIGQASDSAFALTQTTSKVVKRIPVKIEFTKTDATLLTGTNATVKIHIK